MVARKKEKRKKEKRKEGKEEEIYTNRKSTTYSRLKPKKTGNRN
jgi:hypothetical protein